MGSQVDGGLAKPVAKRQPHRLFLRLLPGDWRRAIEALCEMGAMPWRPFFGVLGLNALRAMTEAFGLVLIFPILSYIEHRGDVAALRNSSRLWETLTTAFGAVSLPLNLTTLSAAVLLMIVLRQVVSYIATVRMTWLKETISAQLSSDLFRLVMTARASHVQQIGSGAFVTLVNQQCHMTGSVIMNMINVFVIQLTLLAYGIPLLLIATLPTIVSLLFGFIVALLMKPYAERAKRISRKLVESHVEFGKALSENYQNWRLVKLAFGRESGAETVARWNRRIAGLALDATVAATKIQLFVTPLAAAFVLGAIVILQGEAAISITELTGFVLAFFRLMPSFQNLLRARQALANLSGALLIVREAFAKALIEREPDPGTRSFSRLQHSIDFSVVSYSYPGTQRSALHDVTLSIAAGSMVALTGPSGAGKSTLVDMIPRLIVPNRGKVSLDGVDIGQYRLAELRRAIAYVPQQPLIFDATVKENIRYGCPGATDEDVRAAAATAHADTFIRILDRGFDTMLGEGGLKLSGGQRQRIALARAFLTGASILILDEPTSALDYESERQVQLALEEMRSRGEVTVIIIAHRLSTIRVADSVVVLKEGAVVEQGAPADLVARGGWFSDMAAQSEVKVAAL
jgi:ABC-type multidrug transport system fused ATPase/permease subunit